MKIPQEIMDIPIVWGILHTAEWECGAPALDLGIGQYPERVQPYGFILQVVQSLQLKGEWKTALCHQFLHECGAKNWQELNSEQGSRTQNDIKQAAVRAVEVLNRSLEKIQWDSSQLGKPGQPEKKQCLGHTIHSPECAPALKVPIYYGMAKMYGSDTPNPLPPNVYPNQVSPWGLIHLMARDTGLQAHLAQLKKAYLKELGCTSWRTVEECTINLLRQAAIHACIAVLHDIALQE